MTPLEHYPAWWAMVEQCSGLTRPIREIDWYMVEGRSFPSLTGDQVDGLYRHGPGQIILAERVVKDGQVVRHEMLHALRRGLDEGMHPAEFFLRRCAGVVECGAACMGTSGEAVAELPDYPVVPTDQLEVTVEVDSVINRWTHRDLAYASVVARVRNPSATGVQVSLRVSNGHRIGFLLRLDAPMESLSHEMITTTVDPRAGYFAPGESKSYVFDVYLPLTGNGYGEWSATGGFSGYWLGPPATFKFTP